MAEIQIRALDTRVCDDMGAVCRKLTNQEREDVLVTGKMTVADAVNAILSKLGCNQLSRLTLIMHGYGVMMYGNSSPYYNVSVPFPDQLHASRAETPFCRIYGGYGLQFGSDELSLETAGVFGRLKGKFTSEGLLVIFGCAAADTGPNFGTIDGTRLSGDGPALLRRLASLTGASVRAADTLQRVVYNWYMGSADRGPWSGKTWLFTPDGQQIDESRIPMSVY